MCGICGCIGKVISCDRADEILALINYRGPDASEKYLLEDVFLGHARLAIIDLTAGANQPMYSHDGNYIIVFNGEIYNFKVLRKELQDLGIGFKTSSDTEVIINGFTVFGDSVFEKLNGIFALAIWDVKESSLTLARDRYGVKPLYYSVDNHSISFGSEIKTILKTHPSNQINKQAFREFLDYGNPLGEQTLFNGIKEIKPGTIFKWNHASITESIFWSLDSIQEIDVTDEEVISKTSLLLEGAVKGQLVSDVPVGVFLSGGIDSSLITAFASKQLKDNKLSTYTAAFDFDNGVNELDRAKLVSNYFQTDHHELFIKGEDLTSVVPTLVAHHDSPFSDAANIPLYLLTKELKGSVKVILQGDGGDEFFAGYRRYQLLQKYGAVNSRIPARILNPLMSNFKLLSPRVRRMISAFASNSDTELMARLLTVDFPERNTFRTLTRSSQEYLSGTDPLTHFNDLNEKHKGLDLVQKMLYIDCQTILPRTFLEKVDKSTMANSIEVRVPLLDNDLTDFVLSLPSHQKIRNGEKKWLLKKALRGTVPDFVLDGRKTGFSVPYENWIKGPLYEMFSDTVHSNSFISLGLFDDKTVANYMNEHKKGDFNNGFILWKIFQFALWVDKYKMSV